jgi:outer membrane protein OmpA-like peptidoglycan-associated protein
MIKVQDMVRIPTIYRETLQGLGQALKNEFKNDLGKWRATIDKDLTVKFQEPNIMFETSSSVLKPEFKAILNDFFPRYMRIMTDPKYIENIEEIRIEGHTSTIWRSNASESEAYFRNMDLSQARTRSTLEYLMSLGFVQKKPEIFAWLKSHVRAIGFSSGKPIDGHGLPITSSSQVEDAALSQRVEFRVRTTVEKRVAEIVDKAQ